MRERPPKARKPDWIAVESYHRPEAGRPEAGRLGGARLGGPLVPNPQPAFAKISYNVTKLDKSHKIGL